ncbi:MAG: molecular chaperone DnaJ [Myxococcales bacterium]|nr:molecular chaperone DnaJ [Myxococcales bacterium]
MAARQDYYEILGVARDADDATIKKSYRRLAMELHPDRNPGDKIAEDKFKDAAEAYEVLRDAERRAQYDRFGHEGMRQAGFEGFAGVDDIFTHFADLFGGSFGDLFGGGRPRGGRARGADLKLDLTISFVEAVYGASRDVKVARRVACAPCSGSGAKPGSTPDRCKTCGGRGQVLHSQGFFMIGTACPNCRGSGTVIVHKCEECRGAGLRERTETLTVAVPPGIDDGQTLRLAGKGEAAAGGVSGHLYVVLHVAQEPRFLRDGIDVLTEVPISFVTATLGGKVMVPTLAEEGIGSAELDVEPGTQPGTRVLRRGKGIVRIDGRGVGDQHVQFKVEIPRELTERQRELLVEFAGPGVVVAPVVEPVRRSGIFGRKKENQK